MPEIPDDHDELRGFADLGLSSELEAALARLGYEEPTPIQRAAIPVLLEGRDLLGQAATGTGKTAAFALPVLARLAGTDAGAPGALILAPTRELALQVSEAVYNYGREQGARVVPLVGGQPIGRQIDVLRRGVHVVVATPGRAVDHLRRNTLSLADLDVVVLDEADEMLDMGFAEELDEILTATPRARQTVLFSATLPRSILAIAGRHQRDATRISIDRQAGATDGPVVEQRVHFVRRADKAAALARVIDIEQPGAALVFCRTRTEVDELTTTLNGRGYRTEALHGGMDQAQRDRVMGRLRDGTAELLVATDVAARGLDVDLLTHVFNFNVPSAPESYVHRIGRVGRAGREGVAVTFAEPRERRLLANIERHTEQRIAVGPVPSVADLHAARIDAVVDDLLDAAQGDLRHADAVLDRLWTVVAERGIDLDDRSVTRAAIALHITPGAVADDAREIEAVSPEPPRGRGKADRDAGRGGRGRPAPARGGGGRSTDGVGYVMVSLGRRAGIRPADLVGSIANEAGLPGRDIGPIRITDTYAVVGVPDGRVDDVVSVINGAMIRGKRAKARRWVT